MKKISSVAVLIATAAAVSLGLGVAPASAHELPPTDVSNEVEGSTLESTGPGASGEIIASPTPITIGAEVDQRLLQVPGYSVTGTEGLPDGLTLHADGRLTGKVPPSRAGEFTVAVNFAAGKTIKGTDWMVVRTVGELIQQKSKMWYVLRDTLPAKPLEVGALECPADHPFTIPSQFHPDPFGPNVPNGVRVWTDGALVHAWGDRVDREEPTTGERFAAGVKNLKVTNLALWGTAQIDFTLHCTNDLNVAVRS